MKHSFICLGELIHSLKVAYVASCKALALANKLKRKEHKSRIMGRMNQIRAELSRFESMVSNGDLFDCIKYTGVILGKLS